MSECQYQYAYSWEKVYENERKWKVITKKSEKSLTKPKLFLHKKMQKKKIPTQITYPELKTTNIILRNL